MMDESLRGGEGRSRARSCGLGLALCLLAGCAGTWAQENPPEPTVQTESPAKESTTPAKEPATPASTLGVTAASLTEYTVSPEDLLDIQIMDVPELTHTYRVSDSGTLSLPLLTEPITVGGLTLDQLSKVIAAKFKEAGMLNNAQVTVMLRETRYHTVLMSGEVKRAGSYPIFGPTHLLDLIVQAGGLAEDAGDHVVISRGAVGLRADVENSAQSNEPNPSADGKDFTLDIAKLTQSGGDKANILLYPGDRVVVLRAQMVFIMGAVMRPGGYVLNESRQQLTAMKALAMAGDVNNVAKKDKIVILRRIPNGPPEKRDQIPLDYKKITRGEIADIRLIPDDIVFVPESTATKVMRTVIASTVQAVTYASSSLLIYH